MSSSSSSSSSARRPATPHVFISSTCEDLEPYRAAAKEAVIAAKMLPVMCETFAAGSGNNPPLKECLRQVSQTDVLIVLVAHRYGWKPADQKKRKKGEPPQSITWMECLQAEADGKEVLAFFIGEKGDWPAELKESWRAMIATENGTHTPKLQADINESVAGLKQFKSWLNSRSFRKQVTSKDNLQTEIIAALNEWRTRHAELDAPVIEPGKLVSPEKYLRKLLDATSFIDIRGLVVGTGKAHRFPIEDLYIALKSRGPARGMGFQSANGSTRKVPDEDGSTQRVKLQEDGEIPLQAALSQQRLVVIGDPGAGKTTFLRRVAQALCLMVGSDSIHGVESASRFFVTGPDELGHYEHRKQTFPIFLRCATLANHIAKYLNKDGAPSDPASPAWLAHCVATISQEDSTGLDEAFLRRQLEDGRCTILLDGLDEAPDRVQRDQLSALAENLSRSYSACRLVVTSRPPAYTGNTVLPQFEHVEIAPLSDDAINTFLSHWCQALYVGQRSEADKHCRELLDSLHERPEIRRVARNPVMLTALAVVHWNERRMPEQRAELYDSVITWLSRSREQRPERPKPERTVALLKELALAMQSHPDGRQTQISKRWAAEQLAAIVAFRTAAVIKSPLGLSQGFSGFCATESSSIRSSAKAVEPPTQGRGRFNHSFGANADAAAIAAAEEFLTAEELDSGIVVALGDDIRFWHLQFQEFLAASAIAGLAEADQHALLLEPASKLYLPEWREVLLLFAGALHKQGTTKVDAFVERVLDDCHRSLTLRVEPTSEINPTASVALALADAATDKRKSERSNRNQSSQARRAASTSRVDMKTEEARLGESSYGLPSEARCVGLLGAMFRDLKPVDYVPRDPRYDAMLQRVMAIFERQGSQAVDIRERIAAADALGQVGDPRLHPQAADRWVTFPAGSFLMGSQKTDPLKPNYDKDAYPDECPPRVVELPEFKIARYPVTVEEYQRFVEADGYHHVQHWEQGGFGKWTEPDDWSDQLEHPNRPVVGVSWLEATAYCHWADCRLPTEEEWERAARGTEARQYPWGNEPADETRLNYDMNIGIPTPVGIYPLGHTPEGLADMSGNVLEWCDSWFDTNEHVRVLRGGSFGLSDRDTRAAILFYGTPDDRGYVIGFRVCRCVRTL